MTDLQLGNLILGALTHDVLRYALGAGGTYLVVNTWLARRLRRHKIRNAKPGWPQIRREMLASVRTVLIFAATGILIGVAHATGLVPIYEQIGTYGWPYLMASLVLIVIAHDAWFYWSHRLLHHRKLFRRMHRLHHKSHNPTPFTSYAFDTSEAAVNALFLPAFVCLVPMHPLAILGFVFHMMLRNALGHCGYEVFPAGADGKPLFGWLTTVTHHDLHHADGRHNLGLYFVWWDRLMGTEHPRYLSEYARVALRLPVRQSGLTRIALLAGLLLVAGTAARSDTLRGVYTAPYLGAIVRFEPCPGDPAATCGRLLWGWDIDQWDHMDSGDLMITGLTPGDEGWRGGRLRHPETGLSFRGTITPLADGSLRLKGCAGPICATQRWQPLNRLRKTLIALE